MGKLIMWNIMTVDGYFEGVHNWDLPWHESVWSRDLEDFSVQQLESAEGLLFGRVTYLGMADYWQKEKGIIADYMNRLPKYVASTTLNSVSWNNSILINFEVENKVAELKMKSHKDIFIFGSANLLQTLARYQLIDEFRIGIAPKIHGSGSLLFKGGLPETNLSLHEVRKVSNDCVILIYRTKN